MTARVFSSLAIKCPSCKERERSTLTEDHITCSTPSCDFKTAIACPMCNTGQLKSDGKHYNCTSCKKQLKEEKLYYIFNNLLLVDLHTKCDLCQSPTTHRPDINMGHRCIFHPDCSGQNNLFLEKKEPLLFLDFETSGLEIGKESIIEIGALKVDENGIEHTFETFVKPQEPISPKIQKITGITNEMLADVPSLSDSMMKFKDFIKGTTLVAHNADFDLPWLITALLRLDLEIPFDKVICTLEWARKNKESQCSLGKLSRKYNLSHNNAHRALADAVTTKGLYYILEQQNEANKSFKSIDTYKTRCADLVEKYSNYVQA